MISKVNLNQADCVANQRLCHPILKSSSIFMRMSCLFFVKENVNA